MSVQALTEEAACLQDMKRREQWGHIINISSMAAHRVPNAAESGSAFYAATKHALRALTEGLRQEVGCYPCGLFDHCAFGQPGRG